MPKSKAITVLGKAAAETRTKKIDALGKEASGSCDKFMLAVMRGIHDKLPQALGVSERDWIQARLEILKGEISRSKITRLLAEARASIGLPEKTILHLLKHEGNFYNYARLEKEQRPKLLARALTVKAETFAAEVDELKHPTNGHYHSEKEPWLKFSVRLKEQSLEDWNRAERKCGEALGLDMDTADEKTLMGNRATIYERLAALINGAPASELHALLSGDQEVQNQAVTHFHF